MALKPVDFGEFIVYCMEEYKAAKVMTVKEVITLFRKHNVRLSCLPNQLLAMKGK